MKKILIAHTNDQVNHDAEQIKEFLSTLGEFTTTTAEMKAELKNCLSENEYDLYVIEAKLFARQQDDLLSLPHEKIIVVDADGMLRENVLVPENILYTSSSLHRSALQQITPQIKKILNIN